MTSQTDQSTFKAPSYAEHLAGKRRGVERSARGILRLLLAAPAILLVRLLAAVGIRLSAYPDHFGHQALDIEYHLRANRLKRERVVAFRGQVIANAYLLKKHRELMTVLQLPSMLKRYLHAAEKISIRTFGKALFYSQGYEEKMMDTRTWNGAPPQIEFSEDEHARGGKILERLGLRRGHYACFHAREASYALSYYPKMWSERSTMRTEDAAEFTARLEGGLMNRYRSIDFSQFGKTLAQLERRHIRGVRLGAKVERDLSDELPNLVDFAGRYRPDMADDGEFADLYLMANCKFFVGTASGVTALAMTFSRPLLLTNFFPWVLWHLPPTEGSRYLPKLLHKKGEGLMSFPEMIDLTHLFGWRSMYDDDFLRSRGIEVVDNTPGEIADAAMELCDWTDGLDQSDAEDDKLQRAILDLGGPAVSGARARMGRAFLRQNRHRLSISNA